MNHSDVIQLSSAITEAVESGLARIARRPTQSVQPRAFPESVAGTYIGFSGSYLRKVRAEDRERIERGEEPVGPTYIRIGNSILYLREDLDKWLEEKRRTSTPHPQNTSFEPGVPQPVHARREADPPLPSGQARKF